MHEGGCWNLGIIATAQRGTVCIKSDVAELDEDFTSTSSTNLDWVRRCMCSASAPRFAHSKCYLHLRIITGADPQLTSSNCKCDPLVPDWGLIQNNLRTHPCGQTGPLLHTGRAECTGQSMGWRMAKLMQEQNKETKVSHC